MKNRFNTQGSTQQTSGGAQEPYLHSFPGSCAPKPPLPAIAAFLRRILEKQAKEVNVNG